MRVVYIQLFRRLLIALIALVVGAVGYNYVQTWRQRARLVKQAARILSTEMVRSADSIEYSENENGVTRFRLKAARLLETKLGKSLLEGIEAYDTNPDGTRKNQIRSQKAEYDKEAKRAFFSEDVRILTSAGMELRTDSLRYDLQANVGESDDRLEIISRQIRGWVRGVRYDHTSRDMDLKSEIDLTLERNVRNRDGTTRIESLHARGRRGYYSEPAHILRCEGSASMESDTAVLSGDVIEGTFSEDKRQLTSFSCRGNAVYQAKDPAGVRTLRGDLMSFGIGEESGNLESIDVQGQAAFTSGAPGAENLLGGAEIRVELDPVLGQPRSIAARGQVEFRIKRDSGVTVLRGDQLDSGFFERSNILERMRLWGSAHMNSQNTRDGGTDELEAGEIRLAFRNLNQQTTLQRLDAERAVRWTSAPALKSGQKSAPPVRTLTALALQMLYSESGDFLESGRAAGNATLAGLPAQGAESPEIRRLKADEIRFRFYPGDNKVRSFEGEGNVEIVYFRPPDPRKGSEAQESRTSSNSMSAYFRQADGGLESLSQWVNFVYQDGTRTSTAGRSDYAADKDLLVLRELPRVVDVNGQTTADTITYDRKLKLMLAHAHVRSILNPKGDMDSTPFSSSSGASSPSIVTAEEMRVWTEGSRVEYSGGVQMLSENGQLQAKLLSVSDGGDSLTAEGAVRHLLPRSEVSPSHRKVAPPSGTAATRKKSGAQEAGSILIQCDTLLFRKTENSIQYSGNVVLQSDDLLMTSENMDAVFESGGRKIEKAAARGKVLIRQGGREVHGTTGDYFLDEGRFVVVGNPAVILDPVRGRSAARRLTFFSSDDRILLENR